MTGAKPKAKAKAGARRAGKGNGKGGANGGQAKPRAVWRPVNRAQPNQLQQLRDVRSGIPKKPKDQKSICDRDIFDPRCYELVPTLEFQGTAFPVWDVDAVDYTLPANHGLILCSAICGNTSTIGFTSRNDHADAPALWEIARSAEVIKDSGATFARAMKSGLSLINSSSKLKQQGRVYVLALDQRIKTQTDIWVPSIHDDVAAEIKRHPDVQKYSAPDFSKEKTFVCHPTNNVNYEDFKQWDRHLNVAEYRELISTQGAGSGTELLLERPMSVIWVYIAPTSESQDWTFTFRGAWYARFPQDTIPGRRMQPIPTTPPKTLNEARLHAHSVRSVPRGAAEPSMVSQMIGLAKDHGPSLLHAGVAKATGSHAAAYAARSIAENIIRHTEL